MVTVTINKQTQNATTETAARQNKTTLANKVKAGNQKAQQKPAGATPGRHMTRSQRKNRRRIIRLTELWPDLFSMEAPKPLKAGIFDDLLQDAAGRGIMFGAGVLRVALTSYARRPCYYRALMAGGARYDLKGRPCGEVTPQEQQNAEAHLMALNEKRKQQRRNRQEKAGA